MDFEKIMPMPEELKSEGSPTTIVGSDEEVLAYMEARDSTENRPITQEESNRYKSLYGADNWYDWSNNNWGTKWNISEDEQSFYRSDRSLVFRFSTAWGPPEGVFRYLVDKFPFLEISWFYEEPGMEISGYLEHGSASYA